MKHEQQSVRSGYLLIDAWREEANILERNEKLVSALRLRQMADRAEAALRRKS